MCAHHRMLVLTDWPSVPRCWHTSRGVHLRSNTWLVVFNVRQTIPHFSHGRLAGHLGVQGREGLRRSCLRQKAWPGHVVSTFTKCTFLCDPNCCDGFPCVCSIAKGERYSYWVFIQKIPILEKQKGFRQVVDRAAKVLLLPSKKRCKKRWWFCGRNDTRKSSYARLGESPPSQTKSVEERVCVWGGVFLVDWAFLQGFKRFGRVLRHLRYPFHQKRPTFLGVVPTQRYFSRVLACVKLNFLRTRLRRSQ